LGSLWNAERVVMLEIQKPSTKKRQSYVYQQSMHHHNAKSYLSAMLGMLEHNGICICLEEASWLATDCGKWPTNFD
jgi:hypothetical protein